MKTQALKRVAELVARGANLTHVASLYGVDKVQLEIYMRVNNILFQNPPMPQPHVPNSGDIYPYVIVLVGSFVDGFKYHLIGNGFIVGDLISDSYQGAYDDACTLDDVRY